MLLAAGEYVSQIESMSATCLLMLHLELRVHCFYHLLPLARPKASHPTDNVDPEVNGGQVNGTKPHKLPLFLIYLKVCDVSAEMKPYETF